jgi:hypothetical protein
MAFQTIRLTTLPVGAALLIGCVETSGPPSQDLAAMMLGEWSYSRPASSTPQTPVLTAGFFVSIVVDSARGMRFWGRVSRWLVGDVGLPANRFGSVSGSLDSAYRIVLQIAPGSAREATGYRVEGEVREDQLIVRASWAGAMPGPFPAGCRFHQLH